MNSLMMITRLHVAAAGEEQGEEEVGGRSLGLVRERPAWAGDLRSMGTRGGDGNVR